MKVIFKSKQDYGTHVDEFDEEFDCTIEEQGDGTLITFESGSILIEDKKVTRIYGENRIEIEEGKTTECDYETEQGILVMDIEGMSVERTNQDVGTLVKAKYKIIIKGIEPYTNELEIVIK